MSLPRYHKKTGPAPEIGQIWKSNDWRATGDSSRVFIIRRFEGDFVWVENLKRPEGHGRYEPTGKLARIRKDRFRPNSTGYVLLDDVVTAKAAMSDPAAASPVTEKQPDSDPDPTT